MSADPAELIFFHEMTPEKFFDEVNQLGIPQENLLDQEVHDQVFRTCLVKIRTATAKAVAGKLHLPITEEQARAIACNSLVPEVLPEPAPLAPDQRAIALELYYHAVRAAVARHGGSVTERAARAKAKRMVRDGERGLTWRQRISRAFGC
jgi:plasmid stability protein